MEPLRKLLKKDNPFIWHKERNCAFNKLKGAFNTDEVLIFPDPDIEFIVETDESGFAIGCVSSRKSDKDIILYPVAFHSRSLNKTEMNYTIYDKGYHIWTQIMGLPSPYVIVRKCVLWCLHFLNMVYFLLD